MVIDPKTGLVEVVDRGAKGGPETLKWAAVDVFPNIRLGGNLKDEQPRYVLAESYVPPEPA